MHVMGKTIQQYSPLKCLKADFHLEVSTKIANTVEKELKSDTTNSDG